MSKLLFESSEWDFETLDRTWKAIDKIGKETYNLDYFEPQIEIVSSDQMLELYSSHAMPIMYNHWSFGKNFIRDKQSYQKGRSGLAYEVVINTDPCIAYLMENNTMTMQALVLAHAVCGHSSFFKNNHLFQEWTEPDSIIDYLKFARDYIQRCENKYGADSVESLLDACHAIKLYGVDKYKKPDSLSSELKRQRQVEWEHYRSETFNELWDTIPDEIRRKDDKGPSKIVQGEENLLYFIEKNSPILEPWEKEIVRIVRKINQYFYPQMQTQLMNEGWATFTHYNIMNTLYETGQITEGSVLEFLHSHSGVTFQPEHDDPRYSGINVYALGFAMMQDIRRIIENPTPEDTYWFPEIAGKKDWMPIMQDIVHNYRDESFVLQFLSPKIIRDFKLFSVHDDSREASYKISNVHSEQDVIDLRRTLAKQYELGQKLPEIEVAEVDWKGDRTLTLVNKVYNGKLLESDSWKQTIEYVEELWGFPVYMEYEE